MNTNNAKEQNQIIEYQPQNASNRLSPRNLRTHTKNISIVAHEGINEIITSKLVGPCRSSSAHEMSMKQSTKLKVRTEKSAMVLGSIVILFLFTHSYRMALKLYDVSSPNAHTIEKFKICYTLRR